MKLNLIVEAELQAYTDMNEDINEVILNHNQVIIQ